MRSSPCVCLLGTRVLVVERLRNVWPALTKVVDNMGTVQFHIGGVSGEITPWCTTQRTASFLCLSVSQLRPELKAGLRLFLWVLKAEKLMHRQSTFKAACWTLVGLAWLRNARDRRHSSDVCIFCYDSQRHATSGQSWWMYAKAELNHEDHSGPTTRLSSWTRTSEV